MSEQITIEDLLSKGLAIRKGTWYYLSTGNGVPIGEKLGQNPTKANESIAKLVQSGEYDSLIELGKSVASETGSGKSETSEIDTQPSQKPTEKKSLINDNVGNTDKFASMMGKIQDLNPDLSGSSQGIYVDGIDIRNEEDPAIQKFPFHLRWRAKKNNVENGSGYMNKGYTVFLKAWEEFKQSPGHVTTNRDDTPREPFISIGENVLCILKKSNFKERKESQRLRNTDTINRISEARQQRSNDLALEKDPDKVMSALAEDNQAQMDNQVKQMNQQGIEVNQTIDKFNKFTNGEVAEI